MLGWELPPYNSGGLGTASLGLTQGITALGVGVHFVVPRVFGPLPFSHMRVSDATSFGSSSDATDLLADLAVTEDELSTFVGYGNRIAIDEQKRMWVEQLGSGAAQVPARIQAAWYARKAAHVAAENNDFDMIHTHDWMTYDAGIAARKVAAVRGHHVPLIAHVHATEYDRCGEHGDPEIIAIERRGLRAADHIVAVSNYTKEVIHRRYGIARDKISVVYNGVMGREPKRFGLSKLKEKHKIVLFMGRITQQKGPEYFVQVAKAVTDRDPSVRFVMVGSGDMERRCIEQSARLGLTGKMLFSSFLRGDDVDHAYQLADLFVMPSVSEPFGIVALEAIQNGTPAIVSKQSGVAEVSENLITVDFWDIDRMADTITTMLQNPAVIDALRVRSASDLNHLSWYDSGATLKAVYDRVLSQFQTPQLAPVRA